MERIVRNHFDDRFAKGEYVGKGVPVPVGKRKNGRLLDVGCGAYGDYISRDMEIHGVDLSKPMLQHFKKSSHCDVIVADAKKLPFRSDIFDVVVSKQLLHHLIAMSPKGCLDNVKRALGEMKRVLKISGIVFLREVLTRHRVLSLFIYYFSRFCAERNIECNSLDMHSKVITFFLSEHELERACSEIGLQIKELYRLDWKVRSVHVGKNVQFLLSPNLNA